MRCLRALGTWIGAAGLVLPAFVAADSEVAVTSAGKGAAASAHVRFAVVIPLTLAVRVNRQALAIESNGRSVALGVLAASPGHAATNGVLSAPLHKIIVTSTACAAAAQCTVSMP